MSWHLVDEHGKEVSTGAILPGIGPSYTLINGMDPCADWLLGPGLEDFRSGARGYVQGDDDIPLPCMLRLDGEDSANAFYAIAGNVFVPPIFSYDRPPPDCDFVFFARKQFFDDLRDGRDDDFARFRDASKEMRLGSPIGSAPFSSSWGPNGGQPQLTRPSIGPPSSNSTWPAGTVVIGVIDFGIAFGHDRFRLASGSRVQSFWCQGMVPPGLSVPFGREFDKLEIDARLANATVAGVVDEEVLYRDAGLINFAAGRDHKPAAWRLAHGTHVLDLLAGADPSENVINRPIIAVELPVGPVQDTSFRLLEPFVLLAIFHIFDRAALLSGDGPPLPVVINFSFGMHAGPHDGSVFLERAMRFASHLWPGKMRFVLPSGNGHLARGHAELDFKHAEPATGFRLPWRLQPDDKTPSVMQLWMPPGSPVPAGRVGLSVDEPDGPSPVLEEKPGWRLVLLRGVVPVAIIGYGFVVPVTLKGVFCCVAGATAGFEPAGHPWAPMGLWQLRLARKDAAFKDTVHSWIHRDEQLFGFPLQGRQSYFDHPCYQLYDERGWLVEEDAHPEQAPDCIVKRRSQVSGIATGRDEIVTGAKRDDSRLLPPHLAGVHQAPLMPFSAGGPAIAATFGPLRLTPDTAVRSDDSKVHGGVLSAGARSGSTVTMSGTSVAAPLLGRWIAELLGGGGNGDRTDVQTLAGGPWQPRLGFGVISRPHPARNPALLTVPLKRRD